jgi:hypothetical protein
MQLLLAVNARPGLDYRERAAEDPSVLEIPNQTLDVDYHT